MRPRISLRLHVLAAAAALASAAVLAACGGNGSRPRHLILVTIDTLRADHLSSYGYARPTTSAAGAADRGSVPGFTIDEIASGGVRFANAFAPRGMTLPSMSTVFTGRPPLETCVLDNKNALGPGVETLAERLHAAGFKTAAFSANRLLAPGSGFDRGFETFVQDPSEGDRDARSVEAAQAWIAQQDLEKGPPVFVWLHLVGPHLPYAPEPLEGRDFAKLFANPGYRGAADGSREFLDAAYTQGRGLAPAEIAHVVDLYDAEIARIDHLVSRFLAFCAGKDGKGKDLLDDALLVFAADHGEELAERSRYFGHAKSIYASVLHVPLVMRCPKTIPAGRVVEDQVELEDVLPTVADLLGLPAPKDVRGRSLAPAALGNGSLATRPAFGGWRDRMFTVRSGQWRLVWNPERFESDDVPPGPYPVPEVALFDASIDPKELRDVASEHPDVVHELETKIREWRASLRPCAAANEGPSAEKLKAMQDLGYAGGEK